jgi:hypothetical protein
MTDEKAILAQLESFPEHLKQEVLHYVEFLQAKYKAQNRKPRNRKAGTAEGKFNLAADFEAPLKDFEEYM